MPSIKPEQIDSLISSGRLGHLYLFDGPENWLKERALEKILDKYLPPEARDFNLNRYDGNTAPAADVVAAINSLPFLSDCRLIIVRSADEFSAADQRLIGEALPHKPSTSRVFFTYSGKANLREEISAQVASHGDIVTFWAPFENQLPAWITAETKRKGKSISWDAAQLLAESCADLQEISNELDKLILLVGKRATISRNDVISQGPPDQTGDYNDLEEALWNRKMTEALAQGDRLSNSGVSAEAILPVFERVFRTLLHGHFLTQTKKSSLSQAMSELGLRGKLQQMKFEKGMMAYKPSETEEAISAIAQADYDLKSGALPSRMVVSLLTLQLMNS